MPTLKDIKDDYEDLSGKASEVCRQLNFAGIGIIWIFNQTVPESVSPIINLINQQQINFPSALISPLILFCISLGLDLIQYVISTFIWYGIYLCKHKKNIDDSTIMIEDPEWMNILSWLSWLSKITTTIWAYILIAKFLFNF